MNNFDILKDKIDKLVVIYEECVFPNFSRSDFKKITYFECLLGNITFDECQELDSYIDKQLNVASEIYSPIQPSSSYAFNLSKICESCQNLEYHFCHKDYFCSCNKISDGLNFSEDCCSNFEPLSDDPDIQSRVIVSHLMNLFNRVGNQNG